MAAPKFQIDSSNARDALAWLEGKFARDPSFPTVRLKAAAKVDLSKLSHRSPDSLQAWVNEFLSEAQRRQLGAALRARRSRAARRAGHVAPRTITLTPRAHAILSTLAERDNVTLSEIVEKYFGDQVK